MIRVEQQPVENSFGVFLGCCWYDCFDCCGELISENETRLRHLASVFPGILQGMVQFEFCAPAGYRTHSLGWHGECDVRIGEGFDYLR